MSRDSNLHSVSIIANTLAPSPGFFKNISLNTQNSVDPGPGRWRAYGDSREIFNVWCGGVFSPDYSPLGAIICHGGGHDAYYGNEAYAFDISTRLWVRVGFPSPYNQSDNTNLLTTGEYPDGQPQPPHTYDGQEYLSPANGGGPKGSYLEFGYGGASYATPYVHRLPLDTGPNTSGAWSRWSPVISPAGVLTGYPATACDSLRNRIWINSTAQPDSFGYFNASTGIFTHVSGGGLYDSSYDGTMGWHPGFDMLVMLRQDYGNNFSKLYGKILPTGAWTQLNVSNPTDGPFGQSNQEAPAWGINWSAYGGYFVSYRARASYVVNKLVPPSSNPLSNAWTWVPVTMAGESGATPTTHTGVTHGQYSRFLEVPALSTSGNPCFIWADSAFDPVQLWRL